MDALQTGAGPISMKKRKPACHPPAVPPSFRLSQPAVAEQLRHRSPKAARLLYTPSIGEFLQVPGVLRRPYWPSARLRAWQEERLRAIVAHAAARVPFYRDLLGAAGIEPASIRTLDDLARLPLVPGRLMKSQPHGSLLAEGTDLSACRVVETSGSTGQPLAVAYSRRDHFLAVKAMAVRHYHAHGVGPRARLVGFSPHPDAVKSHAWYERLGFWPRVMLHTNADPADWVAALRGGPHDVVAGSPMTLVELARALAASADTPPRPRVVFSSGARLEPADRALIADTFGVPVVDVYGAYEGGFVAWQCPVCPGYHVNTDSVILEVLTDGRPAGPGEAGEVFVTNLNSSTMPFIRYGLGDVVTVSREAPRCGRSLPLIEAVWGRNDDSVRLPSGRAVGPYPIYMCLLDKQWIGEWRLTQEPDGGCTLAIVPRGGVAPEGAMERTHREMSAVLGEEAALCVMAVPEIARERGGKWKTIVSRVPRA
jgi:phenylacetate-CoA ligase